MLAPTVMKKSPSSRPLNGARSASSSWRYSLLASTTPARNDPSAGDRPSRIIISEMPAISSSAAATWISRSPDISMKRKNGRVRNVPPRITSPTAATTSSACIHPATPSIASAPPSAAAGTCPDAASRGRTARSGSAATSWNSSTANPARPPSVRLSFFSASVCITIAVEDRLSTIPTATASFAGRPRSVAQPAIAAMVRPTCNPPSPRSRVRISQSVLGCISRPIRNSISTTPNSA